MLVHLYDVRPVLKQHVQQLGYSIPRLHPRSQHSGRGSTMLPRLHAAGWCLVIFFKSADFLVIQGTRKTGGVHNGGGARLLGGVRLLGIIRYGIY